MFTKVQGVYQGTGCLPRYRVLHCAGLPGLQPHLVPGEGLQLVQGEGEGELEGAGAPGNSIISIVIVSSFIVTVCSTFVSPLTLYCIPQYVWSAHKVLSRQLYYSTTLQLCICASNKMKKV